MTELALFQSEYPLVSLIVVLIYGAVAGSFLNLVAARLPVMMDLSWREQAIELLSQEAPDETGHTPGKLRSPQGETFNLLVPPSRCPSCRTNIRARDKIPLISYLLLGGKCSSCAGPISLRYPAVELASALLTVMVFHKLGFTLPGFAAIFLTWALIAIALIDQDTLLIPDEITLPFLWLGLICNIFHLYTDISSAVLGAVAGYLALWIVYQVFRLLTGKEGLGFGDFKLLAMLGAWLGWQSLPMILLLSSLTGAIIGALTLLRRGREQPIAFGPYLAGAGWITLLWGADITQAWYRFTMAFPSP